MSVKRLDPSRFAVQAGSGSTPEEAADHDFAIRSGRCPNGCGPMVIFEPGDELIGQRCRCCGFACNSLPDREAAN